MDQAATSTSTSLGDFPPELLLSVFSYLAPPYMRTKPKDAYSALTSCCLVNKKVNSLATLILYERIFLHWEPNGLLPFLLVTTPRLAAIPTTLYDFDIRAARERLNIVELRHLLGVCPNIVNVKLWSHYTPGAQVYALGAKGEGGGGVAGERKPLKRLEIRGLFETGTDELLWRFLESPPSSSLQHLSLHLDLPARPPRSPHARFSLERLTVRADGSRTIRKRKFPFTLTSLSLSTLHTLTLSSFFTTPDAHLSLTTLSVPFLMDDHPPSLAIFPNLKNLTLVMHSSGSITRNLRPFKTLDEAFPRLGGLLAPLALTHLTLISSASIWPKPDPSATASLPTIPTLENLDLSRFLVDLQTAADILRAIRKGSDVEPENDECWRGKTPIQASPIAYDLASSLLKLRELVKEAAVEGKAQLAVLPEAFLTSYPRHLGFRIGARTDEDREWFKKYVESSVKVPDDAEGQDWLSKNDEVVKGSEFEAFAVLAKTAKEFKIVSPLTLLFVYESKHRKLQPTAAERVVWSQGHARNASPFLSSGGKSTDNLPVVSTSIGKIGGLICWENFMPLARYAIYKKGVEIWTAPTADARDTWAPSMQHIAQEGRMFVVSANQFHQKSDYPADYPPHAQRTPEDPDVWSRGGSCIVDPLGRVLAGPLWDKEGILYADLDLSKLDGFKLDFDVVGHYGREDVFAFGVRE
ncbi:hypothetical protein MNV49_003430 [Pseudohyphozyma bogoriensis]|nr:hypothetical protein MNV49_003430 [Pseudohyphozyma bogoriensis]